MTGNEDGKGQGGSISVSPQEMKGEWVECPKCGKRVKSRNLEYHVKRIHKAKLRVESKRGGSGRKSWLPSAAVVLIIVVAGVSYIAHDIMSRDDDVGTTIHNQNDLPDNNDNNAPEGTDDNPLENPPATEWWETYAPMNEMGTGADDWWVNLPDQHPSAGDPVSHPQWILDALETQPVVILDHSVGCAPCNQQMADMAVVLEDHGLEIADYDIVADGSDQRAYECFGAYDPNDAQSYVPLTIMLTLMDDGGGNVQVAWHSYEGATGEEWINEYVEDAIYYHHQNADGWEG